MLKLFDRLKGWLACAYLVATMLFLAALVEYYDVTATNGVVRLETAS